MAREDVIGTAIGRVAREAAGAVAANQKRSSNGRLSGLRGVVAGAGLVALAPIVGKAAGKLTDGHGVNGAVKVIGDKLGDGVKSTVASKVEEAGGATGLAKEAGKGLLPGSGKGESGSGEPGVGSGRRMPVQQAIDVGVPVRTAYNEWTQFEEWPKFMHRVDRVTQEDETHISFGTKVWGISKNFQAEILEQYPDERIHWRVTGGLNHAGVVTFHELAPRLTRIEVNVDVEPSSLIEKAGRGMRYVKRAVRGDMARFKAHLELDGKESGAWRGVIEDGKVKQRRKSSSSARGGSNSKAKNSGSSRRRRGSSNGRKSASTRNKSRSRA